MGGKGERERGRTEGKNKGRDGRILFLTLEGKEKGLKK